MKPLGWHKVRTRVACHQDCGICHGPVRMGRSREREAARREVDQQLEARLPPDAPMRWAMAVVMEPNGFGVYTPDGWLDD